MGPEVKDYKVDLVLADGTRKRAHYDPRRPDVLRMGNVNLRTGNQLFDGARVVSGNAALVSELRANGFPAALANEGMKTFSVRLRYDLTMRLEELSAETGISPGGLINEALRWWLDQGAPLRGKK